MPPVIRFSLVPIVKECMATPRTKLANQASSFRAFIRMIIRALHRPTMHSSKVVRVFDEEFRVQRKDSHWIWVRDQAVVKLRETREAVHSTA